jgi:hypothetical protein
MAVVFVAGSKRDTPKIGCLTFLERWIGLEAIYLFFLSIDNI